MAIRIKSVDKGSAAERLGLAAGAVLLSADGHELNDMLDYQFYTASAGFSLAVSMGGKLRYLEVKKQE